jgi:hypothetical protein
MEPNNERRKNLLRVTKVTFDNRRLPTFSASRAVTWEPSQRLQLWLLSEFCLRA